MISINVLLTTIGREELKTRMLPSLVNQLNENDYLTIVSDINHQFVFQCLTQFDFKCTIIHIMNNVQLGFWGHESRNKHQNNLLGDFIMNADDDDSYLDGAFDMIRKIVIDNNKVYLFRAAWLSENGEIKYSWSTKDVLKRGEIGTMCGVIPNNKKLPKWEHVYYGDAEFYISLYKQLDFEFIDYVIYKIRDTPYVDDSAMNSYINANMSIKEAKKSILDSEEYIMKSEEIANFFWDGELSELEKKCVKSFVDSGFKVKLWSYTNIKLPNVESCDANEILPKNTTLRQELNDKTESAAYLAAFSDYFRYKVVNINKGWWFDTDCYCLRNVSDYKKIRIGKNIISGKQNNVKDDIHHIGCGAFWMNEKTSNKLIIDFEKLVLEANNEIKRFGYFGPEFFTNFVKKYNYYDDILPVESFYSINWNDTDLIIYPDYIDESKIKTRDSFLTHIWTNSFRSKGIDKNNPIEGSFLHYLYNK